MKTKLPSVRGVSVRGVLPAIALAVAAMPMRSLDSTTLPDLATLTDDKLVPTAIETMRQHGKSLCACIDITVENLQDPLKTQFLDIKGQINKSLSTLAETDKVPAAHEANYILRNLLGLFITSQQMMDHLQGLVKTQKSAIQTAKNSLPADLQAAIDQKVGAGEYFTKKDHDAAVQAAITAARTDWEAGLSRVKTRQTALNSASLPVPVDSILALKDEEYGPRETEAKARQEKLKPFNLTPDRLRVLCWDAEQAAFDLAFNTLTEAGAAKRSPGAPDPFRGNTPTPTNKTVRAVC